MARAFSLTLGGDEIPWARGLNTAKRPAELAPNEAQVAEGVDLTAGTLRGAWSPGTALTVTVAANSKFALVYGGSVWTATAYPDWACNDGLKNYLTNTTGSSTYSFPKAIISGTIYRLGIPAPTSAPVAVAGARPLDRTYAVTYYNPDTGYESNPSARTAVVKSGANVTIPTAPASTPSLGGGLGRRIYATEEGDPNGTLFYYDFIFDNTTTLYSDTGAGTGYAVDEDSPLNWGDGGSIDSETTPFDYTSAPAISVMAEEFMGAGSAGILFGANGGTVRWCHAGKVWAWPTAHEHQTNEAVAAFALWQGQMCAFTDRSIWVYTGAADYAITPIKIPNVHPLKSGFGKSVKTTPYGVLYVAREGLALFDGTSSRIITKGILDPAILFSGVTFAPATYFDGRYVLSLYGTGTCLVVEFDTEGGTRVTTMALDAAAFALTQYNDTGIGMDAPGLYVVNRTAGTIHPWRPADAGSVTGTTRQTWEWQTPALAVGAASRLKHVNRARVACALNGGTLAVTFAAKDTEGNAVTGVPDFTHTLTSSADSEFWLPAGFIGHTVTVTLEPSAGTVEVYDLTLEGEVLDAA